MTKIVIWSALLIFSNRLQRQLNLLQSTGGISVVSRLEFIPDFPKPVRFYAESGINSLANNVVSRLSKKLTEGHEIVSDRYQRRRRVARLATLEASDRVPDMRGSSGTIKALLLFPAPSGHSGQEPSDNRAAYTNRSFPLGCAC